MKNWLFIFLGCVLAGCSTLGFKQGAGNPDWVAVDFLKQIQAGEYAQAYQHFTTRYQEEISLEQNAQLWEILVSKLGPLEDYESVVRPFLLVSAKEAELVAGIPPEQVKKHTYDLVFDRRTVQAKMTLVFQEGVYRIGFFEISGTGLETDPAVAQKMTEMGL